MLYNKFEELLLPGNYALTKSMEMTRTKNSGTLWYKKKFLVWYYFIFLSNNELNVKEYINEVKAIFEKYVNSIKDDEVRKEASNFFFPECELINCKSDNFKSFEMFKGQIDFQNVKEKIKFEENAKKYYFAFLIGSGGQSDINKYIKNKLYEKNFNMTKLKDFIKKYKKNATDKEISKTTNDYHAFLRNERQVLFYYGYFHSKSLGAANIEFSSLTPVGEMALYANFDEFLCIWEHQKIKMISQPLIVDIKNIPEKYRKKANNFGISYSPYLDILRYLNNFKEMTLDAYKYIISRNKNNFLILDKEKNEELLKNINKIQKKVNNFNRSNDKENNDFNKELKKYILGLIELEKDKGYNQFSILKQENKKIKIKENKIELFNKILSMYEKLERYKQTMYSKLFKNSENELREKYRDENYKINLKKKAEWELYLMKPEKIILLGIIELNNLDNEEIIERYEYLLKRISINNKKVLDKERKKFHQIINNKISILENKDNIFSFEKIKTQINTNDLFKKIKQNSVKSYKKRNTTLVSLMKSYYLQTFSENNGLLKCECCGKETFMTRRNEPYLEFHHLIPFGEENGPDHYLNIFAICPECHRKLHYMKLEENLELKQRDIYIELDKNNYLQKKIIQRLQELKSEKILKSYQLEFLIYEGAITEKDYNILSEFE